MTPVLVQHLLERIEEEWKSVRLVDSGDEGANYRPWGVWIRQYDAVPEGFIGDWNIRSPLRAVWFLDEEGVRPRSIWEYIRFHVVQFDRPWRSKSHFIGRDGQNPLLSGDRHAIALAAFAPYAQTNDIYYEEIWGGTWGRGWRLTTTETGLAEPVAMLWVS